MRVDTTRAANIHYRCGSSGSGKSWGVKEAIAKAARLIVFDPDDEYGEVLGIETVRTIPDLAARIRTHPRGALKIRLVAGGEHNFNHWAKIAFAWCNCVAVAEEIAGVTSPGRACDGWHTLVSRGRKRGIEIYAVTQRPAEADKTVLGNATTIRTGRLTRKKDRKYVADELDLPEAELTSLQNLDFIQCNMNNMETIRGKMGTKRRTVVREKP